MPTRRYPSQRPQHTILALAEFEASEIALPAAAYKELRALYAGQLDIGPTERAGTYRLVARDYVGRISLPEGVSLLIEPKVSVANLFYMLCAQPELARFYPQPAGLAASEDIFSVVLSALLDALEKLLAKYGLYREYTPRVDDLPFIRARIALGPQLRRYADLKHRHICEYAELTTDTAENKVIAATLRHLPALLRPGVEDHLAERARRLLRPMSEITAISRAEALALFPTINVHRLNAPYTQALGLCRLALQHLTLSERAGPHAFASFLVNMPRLFESFIIARLKTLLAASGLRVVAQRSDYLDEEERVRIRPDALIYGAPSPSSGQEPLLVLDAKYRRLDEQQTGLNRDLYQVSAYMDRYGLRRGALVYPQFAGASQSELKVRGTSKRLHVLTLDLGAPTVGELDRGAESLARRVRRLAAREQWEG